MSNQYFYLFIFSHITATPTSMIFSQEPDISQMHVLKDCNNHHLVEHELVPIMTMNSQALPEVLDNIPQNIQMQDQLILPPPNMMQQQQIMPNVLTGVYTLQEEPELESEENLTTI